MRVSRVRVLFIALVVVLLLPVGLNAQDSGEDTGGESPELVQPVLINDEVTFFIPDPWLALDNDGQITLVSSEESLASVSEAGPVPDGEVFAVVLGGALSLVLDVPPNDPAALAQGIGVQLSGGLALDLSEVDTFAVAGNPAALITWSFIEGQMPQDAGVLAVNLREELQVVFWYVSNRLDFPATTQLMQRIAATLESTAGPESTPEPAPADDLSADALTQTFTTEDSEVTLFLPDSWAAVEEEGTLYFGTSEAAVRSLTEDGGTLPVGAMSVIAVRGQIALGLEVPDMPENVVSALAEDLIASVDAEAISDVFSFMTAGERAGAFQVWGYTLGESPFSTGILALQQAEEEYLVFLFTIRSADATPYIAALQVIAEAVVREFPAP